MGRAYSFRKTETVREITIDHFGGVDFATQPAKVDFRRSPDACNMIADDANFPVKRTGYTRTALFSAPVYGLYQLGNEILCHAGGTLYRLPPEGGGKEPEALHAGLNESASAGFVMNGKLWILDGKEYLTYDGETVKSVSEIAYVPTTTISAPPAGGGVSLEGVNLLSKWRINTFIGDGSSRSFALDCKDIDADSVSCPGYTVSSVNASAGTVTLSTAPANGKGLANVTIKFAKTVPENVERINKCRFFGLYGGKNDTRVFISGNPEEKNCDWQSGLYDPTYFPDTGYTRIGSDTAAIMGYVRQYESQIVVKESGGQDATQYLRTFELDGENRARYPLKQGAQGSGAIAPRSFAELNDVPLFLSRRGVQGVFGTNVAQQRSVMGVSRRIDPRLTKEPGLENAAACVHADKYYLSVNNHCYVADSRQWSDGEGPEWYYWDNVPATCFLSVGGTLYFGTKDGKVMRFLDKDDDKAFLDDGQAIEAWWSTPMSPLSQWARYKTIRDFFPVLMPYSRSGTEVFVRTEEISHGEALTKNLDLFSFRTLDFTRFSFRCLQSATPYRTRRKLRRIYLFQGIIENRRPDEPFGILGLTIQYTNGANIMG